MDLCSNLFKKENSKMKYLNGVKSNFTFNLDEMHVKVIDLENKAFHMAYPL